MNKKQFSNFLLKKPDVVAYFKALGLKNNEQAFEKYDKHMKGMDNGVYRGTQVLMIMTSIVSLPLFGLTFNKGVKRKDAMKQAFRFMANPCSAEVTLDVLVKAAEYKKKNVAKPFW